MGLMKASGFQPLIAAEPEPAASGHAIPDPADRDPAELLCSAAPADRCLGARLLGQRPDSEALLLTQLDGECDPAVREAILLGLLALGSDEAAAGLVEVLHSDDAGLRNAAIETLSAMPEAAAPLVDALLEDADSDIRLLTCNMLLSLPHPGVPAWLCAVAERDSHPNVCAAAVDALAEVGDPGCVPSLQSVAARFPDDAFLRFAVDAAIQRLGGA
ncbi:HEAT repeat domain-containing protein [Marinibaculum pumilum]|uniref:HEAT repeat domain-containing protein n=1 Tax=Marinibaculum pumilum TaxID=1766165 RepID=A0ABV7KTQ6_9PROT